MSSSSQDPAVRDAERIAGLYGDAALDEARYRCGVARNRGDAAGVAHWTAVCNILFRRRFGIRPGQALQPGRSSQLNRAPGIPGADAAEVIPLRPGGARPA